LQIKRRKIANKDEKVQIRAKNAKVQIKWFIYQKFYLQDLPIPNDILPYIHYLFSLAVLFEKAHSDTTLRTT
jgi:hypothetical protein